MIKYHHLKKNDHFIPIDNFALLCEKIPERPPFVFKMADKTSKIASMSVTPYSSVPHCSLTREYDSWLNGLQKIAQKLY